MTLALVGRSKDGAVIQERRADKTYTVLCACGQAFIDNHATLVLKLRNSKSRLWCPACFLAAQSNSGRRASTVGPKRNHE